MGRSPTLLGSRSAFGNVGVAYLDEFGLSLELFDVAGASVGHTAADASEEVVDELFGGA